MYTRVKTIQKIITRSASAGALVLCALSIYVLGLIVFPHTTQAAVETFTTSGTSTWIAPAGVYEVTVQAWGAGGGSGGGTNTVTPGGSGGGGGAYASQVISVTPGNSYTYSVGAGGPADTGSGGNTRFVGDGAVEARACGGTSGAVNGGTAGTGGSIACSEGTTEYAGGNGAAGSGTSGGGGGESASTTANGNDAVGTAGGTGTSGTDGSAGQAVGVNGVAGNNPGAGAGGAGRRSGGSEIGATGGTGLMILTYNQRPISISGTLYENEGVTAGPSGKTIKLVIGTSTPSTYTTTTSAGGTWSFSITTYSDWGSSTPVLVFVDADTSTRGSTFTKASGTTTISNLHIYQNRVIVRHEGGAGTTTTLANLGFYDGDDDTDIQYTSNTSVLTVRTNQKLYVWPSTSFTASGTITVHGNASSTSQTDGSFHIATGSIFYTIGTTTLAGSFTASNTAQYFNPNQQPIIFSATTTGKHINAPLPSLRKLIFNGSGGGWSMGTTSTTTDLTLSSGTLTPPITRLTITGNYTNTGGTFAASGVGTTTFAGLSVKTATGTMIGTSAFNHVEFAQATSTWTARSAAGNDDSWYGVTYGNGLFVAVSGSADRVMTSSDGITWTAGSAAGNDDSWYGVTYGNGLFVAVSGSGDPVMTSSDGITWTARSAAGNDDSWRGVTYGNGLFIAVGNTNDRVMTSSDGITWTARSAAGNDDSWTGVTYGNGLFVAVSGSGTDRVMTSSDGITWTARSAAGNDDSWRGVTYGNGLFVAVSNGISGTDRVMTSSDGITWTARSAAGNDDSWTGVTYGNGLFVAVSGSGTDRVMTSSDGITWTARSAAGNDDSWTGVTYGNGLFVAVSDFSIDDRIITSLARDTQLIFGDQASTTNLSIGTSATITAPTSTLSISGNYTNSGTFTAGSGTTTFNGTSAQTATGTMTGTSAFNNIEIITTNGTTTFAAPLTVSGHFKATTPLSQIAFIANATTTLNTASIVGTSGNTIKLRSTVDGTAWNLYITGAYTFDYLDVKDSNACSSGTITPTNSTDSTGNTCWNFGGGGGGDGILLSGTLYQDEGVTTLTTGKTLGIAVGTTTPSIHTTTSNGSGVWSFTVPDGHTIGTSTPILIWIDGDTTTRGALFTKATSTNTTVSGLDLYQNRVIIRHQSATTSTTTRLSDLTFYDNDNDADIQYNAATNALVVQTNQKLYIWPDTLFSASGTVEVRGNASSTSLTDGSMHLASGALYRMFGTTTLAGNFTASNTAQVVDRNTGTSTFIMNATTTGKSILAPITTIGNIIFNGSGGEWTFATNSTTTSLTITNGTVVAPSSQLTIGGSFTNNGTFTHNGGTTTFSGLGTTISGTVSGVGTFNNVTFGNSGPSQWQLAYQTFSDGSEFAIDEERGVMYVGGLTTVVRCVLTTGCDATSEWTTATTTHSTAGSYNLVIDAANNVIYAGGNNGFILRCDIVATECDGTVTDFTVATDTGATRFFGYAIDATNGAFYAAGTDGTNGQIYKCLLSTGCDGAADFTIASSSSGAASFRSIYLDQQNGVLYTAAAFTGIIYRCVASTGCDGAGEWTISYDTNASYFNDFVVDPASNMLYTVGLGGGGRLLGCNLSTSCDAAGDWTVDITVTTEQAFKGITLDPVNQVLYVAGGGNLGSADSRGVIYRCYAPAGCSSSNDWKSAGHITRRPAVGFSIYEPYTKALYINAEQSNESSYGIFRLDPTVTFGANASTSNMSIDGGYRVKAPSYLSVSGQYVNSGIFTASSTGTTTNDRVGTTTFSGTSAQTLSGNLAATSSFANVVFTGSGAKTVGSNASTTNFNIEASSGAVTAPAHLTIAGSYSNSAIFTHNSGTTTFSSSTTQIATGTMTGTSAFGHVVFTGAGTKTFGNNASTTNLSIEASSGVVTAPSYLSLSGHYNNLGTFTHSSGSVLFNGSDAQTASGTMTGTSAFNNLTFTGSGQKQFITNASSTNFTVVSGSGVVVAPSQLSVSGNYSNDATFTAGTGTTTFNGTNAQTATGTMTGTSAFGHVVFTGAGTKTFGSDASTTNFIQDASATVTAPVKLSVAGHYTNNSVVVHTGTTTFNGTSAQTATGTMTGTSAFSNLRITNTSGTGAGIQSVRFEAPVSTTNTFSMIASTSATFAAGATSTFNNINLAGASGQYVWLRSTASGTPWGLDVSGTQNVVYVNVKDSHACSGNPYISAADGTSVDAGGNSCWTLAGDALAIQSAADQTFSLNGPTTTISTITLTDASIPTVTADNDIRIKIATSTVYMKWNTVDPTATFSGTAAAKVSTTVSYEGGGSVLVINVTENFAASDTLVVSGLSYTHFTATNTATTALSVYTGGASDTVPDNSDGRDVTITGSLTLSDHSNDQVSDAIQSPNATDVEIFRFTLEAAGETATVASLALTLTGVNGIATDDLTNIRMYYDQNSNGEYDTGEVQVGGTPVLSLTGQAGTITWSSSFVASTSREYIVVIDIASIRPGDMMSVQLLSTAINATGDLTVGTVVVAGTARSVQHMKNGGGGGGNNVTDDSAPAGQGIQTGGGQGGGSGIDTNTGGTSLGDLPGYNAPSTNGSPQSGWTNGGNGITSDGSYATAVSGNLRHTFGGLDFSIPGNNQITGIEVKLEGSGTTAAGEIQVRLSWDGGTSLSDTLTTGTLTATDAIYTLGGPSSLWGRSWTPAEISSLAVEVIAQPSSNTVQIDAIRVRVYHQATGGGGGGGGEVWIPIPVKYAMQYDGSGKIALPLDEFLTFLKTLVSAGMVSHTLLFTHAPYEG